MTYSPFVSVIVTTYNWPSALERVLSALCAQQYTHFEVILADDGSGEETAEVVRGWQSKHLPFPLHHCWQTDEGFRAAMIRNRAAARANGTYFIFLDGDCIPFPSFVKNHVALSEKGYFVAGNRILLSQPFTKCIVEQQWEVQEWPVNQWAWRRLKGDCNRILPLCTLPLGPLRKCAVREWKGVKTCNLGVWRDDFIAVNGLDEGFQGWGYEDSDLAIRLIRKGVLHKRGKWALGVLHLWHGLEDKTRLEANFIQLKQTLASDHICARQGVSQYFSSVL